MSKGVFSVALALVGVLVLSSAPAWTAQRALTKQNCEGAGGTFSSHRGVKYCASVASVFTEEGALAGNETYVPFDALSAWRWTAGYRIDTTYAQVVTESQIGNREVLSSTENVQVDQTVVPLGCMKWRREDLILGIVLEVAEEDRPLTDCEALGLYPTL
jgi:hypothetical protein